LNYFANGSVKTADTASPDKKKEPPPSANAQEKAQLLYDALKKAGITIDNITEDDKDLIADSVLFALEQRRKSKAVKQND